MRRGGKATVNCCRNRGTMRQIQKRTQQNWATWSNVLSETLRLIVWSAGILHLAGPNGHGPVRSHWHCLVLPHCCGSTSGKHDYENIFPAQSLLSCCSDRFQKPYFLYTYYFWVQCSPVFFKSQVLSWNCTKAWNMIGVLSVRPLLVLLAGEQSPCLYITRGTLMSCERGAKSNIQTSWETRTVTP